MTGGALAFLAGAMAIFLAAASALRAYVSTGQVWLIVASLALYGAGNLLMVRLMREGGLGLAISASAIAQLLLVNLIAFAMFGERLSNTQMAGVALAAFGLFRFFDAVKLGPMAWADQRFKGFGARGGFGILLDDFAAAFCTLIVIALWRV